MSRHNWSQEHDELAVALWKAGKSGSQIGAALGITRNAAIGRLHRLGMTRHNGVHRTGRQAGTRNTLPRKPAAKQQKSKPFARNQTPLAERPPPRLDLVQKTAPSHGEPKSKRVTIYELTSYICHWPHGCSAPYTYCGALAVEGAPYCEYHCSIAYAGKPQRLGGSRAAQ